MSLTKVTYSMIDGAAINVLDYGATGDGVTDDTVAIQAALTALPAGGGFVYLPAGNYIITSALQITKSGTKFAGDSRIATNIIIKSTDSKAIRIVADADQFEICDLTIKHAATYTAVSGFAIQTETSGILGGIIQRISTVGVFGVAKNTITSGSVNNVTFRDCLFLQTVQYGIWLQYTVDWVIDNCVTEIATRNAGTVALMVESNNDGMYMSKSLFLNAEKGMLCQNTLGGVGSRHFFFEQSAWDGAGVNAAEFTALFRSRFVNCWFASVYGACNGATLTGNFVKAITFEACIFLNLGGHGAQLIGQCTLIKFVGCDFTSWGIAVANTYSGIVTDADSGKSFIVEACQFFADPDFPTSNPWQGITIGAGTYQTYLICNNIFRDLVGVNIADSGTSTTSRVINNPGYNPVTAATLVVGASPFTYTAGKAPEAIYITSGTVSNISVAGLVIYTSTDRTIHLAPNQQVIVTYSVIPTMRAIPE